jgi:UDP-N-acetylglucosamine 4-epimerase
MNLLAAKTDNDETTDQVYHVALNDRTSLNELYHLIENRLIQSMEELTKKQPTYRDFRAVDLLHSRTEISKAQQLLGFQPSHKIAEGLDETMDWYVDFPTK